MRDLGAKWFSTQHILWLLSLSNWEKSFYYFGSFSGPGLWETQIPTKTGRPWNEMRRPGVQFHVVTQWLDKGPDFLWWNMIFDKGEMSKNPGHFQSEVYLYSFIVSPWMWSGGIWTESGHRTPNLVYQRILKLETWRKSGSQCWDKCLFLLKFNQSLFLCISDSMRFFLFGFEDIFIFCVAILLNSVGKKICALCFRKTLYS